MNLADYAFWTAQYWDGHTQALTTLGMYTVGIAGYALIVFFFYRYMAMKDLRMGDGAVVERRTFGRKVLGALRYLFLFPVISFGYAVVLVASMFVLAKSLGPEQALLTAMSVVAGVRATAYISEGAAEELARLVPVGLLGVLIVEPGYLSLDTAAERFYALPALLPSFARYFLAFVALELTLRLLSMAMPKRRKSRQVPVENRAVAAPPKKPVTRADLAKGK